MSGSRTTVACGNCGRGLEERSDLDPSEREPCPVCGSRARAFSVEITATVGALGLTGDAPEVHVESTPVDQTPEAKTIRGRYRATLDWYALNDGFWLLHVVNETGEVVEGGIGNDPEAALLEVYERLIPPGKT